MQTLKTDFFGTELPLEIRESGHLKVFPVGTVILDFNAYIKSIPIVLSGTIKVIQSDPEGRELLLYYIQPGESCIMSLLGGLHNETSKIKAMVEEEVELLLLPVDKAKDWVVQFPEWTHFILDLYQKRFEELLEIVNSVAFQKLDVRLLHLLQQKSRVFHSREIGVTHQQLADELGITREAVSRVLKQMEKEGHIALYRNKVQLM